MHGDHLEEIFRYWKKRCVEMKLAGVKKQIWRD